jgi:hypothetical protein
VIDISTINTMVHVLDFDICCQYICSQSQCSIPAWDLRLWLCIAGLGTEQDWTSINLKILSSTYNLKPEYSYWENCDIWILSISTNNPVHLYGNLGFLYPKFTTKSIMQYSLTLRNSITQHGHLILLLTSYICKILWYQVSSLLIQR